MFLEQLISRFGDPSVVREYFTPDYIDYLAKAAADTENQRHADWIHEMRREVAGGRYHSGGSVLARVLVPVAARHMGSDFEAVDFIPVGLLPSRSINGFVACGDHGECALVLDDCVPSSGKLLFQGLIGWLGAAPPQPTDMYPEAVAALAAYNVTGNSTSLRRAWDLLRGDPRRDEPHFDDNVDALVLRVLLFLLLHEYAHVAKGHLESAFTELGVFPGKGVESAVGF